MLFQVPMCSSWLLWEQGCLPLLQQLEDQAWRTQMPLKLNMITYNIYNYTTQLRSGTMATAIFFGLAPTSIGLTSAGL